MNDELLNRRVLREVTKAGKPITCYEIKELLHDRLSDVRGALEQLVEVTDPRWQVWMNGRIAAIREIKS